MKNYTAFQQGRKKFTPIQLPNLGLWLPPNAFSITSGTINGADQSGHHNNVSQAGTTTTIVAASSGNPAHVHFSGTASSQMQGTWISTIPAGQPFTIYTLRKIPVNNTGGRWFGYDATYVLDHDAFGAPGRTLLANAGQFLTNGDNSIAWVVDTVVQGATPNTATLYLNNVQVATGASNDQGVQTGNGLFVGGPSFAGGADGARDLSQIIVDFAADDATTRTKVYNYLIGTIPP